MDRDRNGPVGHTPNSVERRPKQRRQNIQDENNEPIVKPTSIPKTQEDAEWHTWRTTPRRRPKPPCEPLHLVAPTPAPSHNTNYGEKTNDNQAAESNTRMWQEGTNPKEPLRPLPTNANDKRKYQQQQLLGPGTTQYDYWQSHKLMEKGDRQNAKGNMENAPPSWSL